jgi:hypothetical protein
LRIKSPYQCGPIIPGDDRWSVTCCYKPTRLRF